MPDTTPKTKTISRSFAIGIGVTEIIYLLGLVALAAGISLALGIEWALIVVGLFLIRTAEQNAKERNQ
jgi:cytochrome c biogenesis protein CcdA